MSRNTIAHQVKRICEGYDIHAYSLYAGQAINQTTGKFTHFPTGHEEIRRVNEKGRCVYARYRYADNSRLIFTHRDGRTRLLVS